MPLMIRYRHLAHLNEHTCSEKTLIGAACGQGSHVRKE